MSTYLDQLSLKTCEALFLFENFALGTEGTTVATDSISAVGSLGVANLLSPALDTAYRSKLLSDAESLKSGKITVRFTLGQSRPIDCVAIVMGNCRVPWAVDFYRGNPSVDSPVFSSSWTDPIVRGKVADYEWRTMPWNLGPSERELSRMASEFRLRSLIQSDQTYYGIRYVDIRFDVTSERLTYQGADYLQFGLPFIGQSFQPEINVLLDWELGIEDRSEVHRTEAGGLLGRHRAKLGTLAFALGYLSRDEALTKLFSSWMRRHGKLGRIFAWIEPDQPGYFYDQSMVATATSLPNIAMTNVNLPSAKGWQLTETE